MNSQGRTEQTHQSYSLTDFFSSLSKSLLLYLCMIYYQSQTQTTQAQSLFILFSLVNKNILDGYIFDQQQMSSTVMSETQHTLRVSRYVFPRSLS